MDLQPLSSPLRIRRHDGRFQGSDRAGALVLDGAEDGDDPLLAQTARGEWRIRKRVKDQQGRYNVIEDADGREVARVDRHLVRRWEILLPGGDAISVTSGNFSFLGHSCRVGSLARARAPFLLPNRYLTLTLRPELLARPDADLLAVVGAWVTWIKISTAIQVNATSSG